MKQYEHKDNLGQIIKEGDAVAFTSSYLSGVKLGVVRKLTRCRVRIHYRYTYLNREGQICKAQWTTLIAPERVIALNDQLPQAITMKLLTVC